MKFAFPLFSDRVTKRWTNGSPASGPSRQSVRNGIEQEEVAGLGYILVVRLTALFLLAAWALTLPLERSASYLGAIVAFAVLGTIPYLLARMGYPLKYFAALFVLVDAAILTYILIVPPSFYVDGWTPQINLRLPNFLFLGIFLISMALSYSPGLVVWAGAVSIATWRVGFLCVVRQPGTVLCGSRDTLDSGMSAPAVIARFLSPNTVSVTNWYNQLVFLVLVTLILTLTVWRSRQLVRKQVAAENERANLSRYFSPNIIQELTTNPRALDIPVEQPVAVLFADMMGFSTISERLVPKELLELLKEFHARLAQIAFAHGGTVDKYIGDSIMVHFGTPRPMADDPVRALACAAAMIQEIKTWNVERAKSAHFPVKLGIGVHYGQVIVGNIGHAQRLEYTVLGDTVNVANRLERLTRQTDSLLMVSDILVRAVQSQGCDPTTIVRGLEPDSARHVRGRHQPVAVWSLARVTDF